MKGKRLCLLLALLVLLAACSGAGLTDGLSPPGPEGRTPPPAASAVPGPELAPEARPAAGEEQISAAPSETPPESAPAPAPSPTPGPSPTPEPSSAPAPQPAGDDTPRCTLSISCAVLLDRLDSLDGATRELVPEGGWLLPPTQVALEEGDSVFDLLLRACRDRGIHMEFSTTPGLGTAYIEGIGNLYEFDCGDLSGWVFAVNGVLPNRGCSDVFPESGDRVEWCYTCALGGDLPRITRG